jgi:aminoglycoside phosphotransferase (APT) family kinase protein
MDDKAQLDSGSESAVYRLQAPGGDVIVKEATAQGHQQYPFEAFAYQQMEQQGAKVPHVISADDQVLIMTALGGKDIDNNTGLFTNRLASTVLFIAVGADLAKAHSIELPSFGKAIKEDQGTFKGQDTTWANHLGAMTPLVMQLRPQGHLTSQDVVLIQNYWNDTLPKVQLEQGVLVHGDFALTAIFAHSDSTYSGIIDFGDALIGDPLMDLAYFGFKEMTKSYGQQVYDLLLNGYVKATGREWGDNEDMLVCFYMVYWGIRRLEHCPNEEAKIAFINKLHALEAVVAKQSNASIGYKMDGDSAL